MVRIDCQLDPPHANKSGTGVAQHGNVRECKRWEKDGMPRWRPQPGEAPPAGPTNDNRPPIATEPPKRPAPSFFSFSDRRDTAPEPSSLPADQRAASVGQAIANAQWKVSTEKTVQFCKTCMALLRGGFKAAETGLKVQHPFQYAKIAIIDSDEEAVGAIMQGPLTTFCKEVLKCETLEEAERAIDYFSILQVFGILSVEMTVQVVTEWPQSEVWQSWKEKGKKNRAEKEKEALEATFTEVPAEGTA